ncbi:nucleoside-diphosphate-sugar epimerase [Deinococcus marmoris]|uniref:Nucleoside-diphosphate-sugar epimerase n=1 Tax=Deinococcus marmoris TaxID=249408 RepID=A0A1U7NT70_9DEIO|nr:nucleoside-diphosphate-sugar epimerase [Deinococcus marmoris]
MRALVRDPQKAQKWANLGVELHPGDLTDAQALTNALAGVEGAFIMQPTPFGVTPDFPEARAINASVAQALHQSSPPKLVVLSSVGSEQSSGLGNITQTHLLEVELRDVTFPIAFVRAGGFLENNLGALGPAASSGIFNSFLQPTDQTFPMIASQDIGNEVARLLLSTWDGKKIVELGSPVSPDDLARAMGEVLGRDVQAQALPRDRWTGALSAMGLPDDKTAMWEEMQDGFNSGWIHFGMPGTKAVAGTLTPAQVFAEAARHRAGRHGPSES